MDEPLALALKFGFIAVLYLFLMWVVRSAMRDLRRSEATGVVVEPVEPPKRKGKGGDGQPDLRAGVDPRLEVVAALGIEPGRAFEVGEGAMLGRSDGADIRIDDPFASSAHARIFSRGEFMYVEDMGSTNGTYLNGRQIRDAERLKMADVIRIGDSEYRYQE